MYYRVHFKSSPPFPFGNKNAFSAPWGTKNNTCGACNGTGVVPLQKSRPCQDCGGWGDDNCGCWGGVVYYLEPSPCPYCNGTGKVELLRGYSCFDTPEKLVAYFALKEPADNEPVVVFAGEIVGLGPDGEMLVIPAEKPRPRWITWKQVRTVISRRFRKKLEGVS